jgi:hypothetical protein
MSEETMPFSRAIAGFLAGAAVVLIFYLWQLWPDWQPVVLFGGGAGIIVIAILGIPSFLLLRKHGMLSIYAAAILGAIFCWAPILLITLSNLIGGSKELPGAAELEFWLLYLLLPGLCGGIVGWLVAAGFRLRAS